MAITLPILWIFFGAQRYKNNGYWLLVYWLLVIGYGLLVIGYGQGLRILFFIWASRRGLGDDASKRRNAYFFIWASRRGLGDDAFLVLTV